MSAEVKKYNPVNFSPENLFRPPTSSTHGELSYLIDQLSHVLEGTGRIKERRLLVGTELEMFFFSPDEDPTEAYHVYGESTRNPNYTSEHHAKIELLQKFGNDLKRNSPSEFMDVESIGKIGLEYHTAPQQVDKHLETMERFAELIRKKSKTLNVLPVVHSQHIHISMRNNPIRKMLSRAIETDGIIPEEDTVKRAFSRVNPLVLLPEEWDDRYCDPHYIKNDGIKSLIDHSLDHPEFRKLSSEYANDPVLNLLLSLRAMYAGCLDQSSVSEVELLKTYKGAVTKMGQDSELAGFFGQSTLSALTRIVSQYPAVSKREININQVA